MKISYAWLQDWVSIPWPARELGDRLTMAGFELEGLTPAAPEFSGVVVARIVSAERHPQADKLQVCRVETGGSDLLQIVCGAANARAGLRTALAQVDAVLPGGMAIKGAKLRGVESAGMLCSAKELGLAETSDGIIEFPDDAPLGTPLRDYLSLDDSVLELNVTPNRGDAMSVLGIAREVAALAGGGLQEPLNARIVATGGAATGGAISAGAGAAGAAAPTVTLIAEKACPKFLGCLVRGVDNRRKSPLWLRERLRRAGSRSLSPVVDVTNYVLLELGQPMHAYDAAKVHGGIDARLARAGEPLTLLDGKDVTLDADMLVIADQSGAVGLAGVMGGQRTAVSDATTDVFLEAAWFAPDAIAGRARRLGLTTDASQRFERGVDPTGQLRAMQRAIAILSAIAGGSAGAISTSENSAGLPQPKSIRLRVAQMTRLLGTAVPSQDIQSALERLGMQVSAATGGALAGSTPRGTSASAEFSVTAPAHRFDIANERDLIEEIARQVGYVQIPEVTPRRARWLSARSEAQPDEVRVLDVLAARGYFEAINFAFVDPAWQSKLFASAAALALANPIASDLAVMRVSLWPGLLRALLENQRRQQSRVRLFESGAVFVGGGEVSMLGGASLGQRTAEQWGLADSGSRGANDLYDARGDVEALLSTTGAAHRFIFEPASVACLHPGRSAAIRCDNKTVGHIGELHPRLVRELDFAATPILFELEMNALSVRLPDYEQVSRFPAVRRDLAIVIDEIVPFSAVHERVTFVAGAALRELRVFDVYRGPGVEIGRKSLALGLILQEKSRTLTDEETARLMAAVAADLQANCGAQIR